MGLITGLAIAGGLLGGALLTNRLNDRPSQGPLDTTGIPDPNPQGFRPRPPGAETTGRAVPRDTLGTQGGTDTLGGSAVDAIESESNNVSSARIAAQRARRRAIAGNAGPSGNRRTGGSYNGAPKTLIGS